MQHRLDRLACHFKGACCVTVSEEDNMVVTGNGNTCSARFLKEGKSSSVSQIW